MMADRRQFQVFTISLQAQEPPWPTISMRHVHAAFFGRPNRRDSLETDEPTTVRGKARSQDALLSRYNPPLVVTALHDAQLKPFALAPVDDSVHVRKILVRRDWVLLHEIVVVDRQVRLQVAALTGDAVTMIARTLDAALRAQDVVRLGTTPYRFERVDIEPNAARTYQDVLEQAEPVDTLRLRFVSPVKFRPTDAWPTLEPEPRWIFGETLRRWQRLTEGNPLPIALTPDDLVSRVTLTGRDTRFAGMALGSFSHRVEVGFNGRAEYAVSGPAEVRQLAAAVATFGALAGIGARTAVGLGRIRVSTDAVASDGGHTPAADTAPLSPVGDA